MKTLHLNSLSLNKRIIDAHLMIGLGCIFTCIVATVLLAIQGSLLDHISVIVALPLLILCISTFLFRKSLRTYTLIEKQLQRVGTHQTNTVASLRQLRETDTVSRGWNLIASLLERVHRENSLVEKLDRLFSTNVGKNWQEIFDACPDAQFVTNAELIIRSSNLAFHNTLCERQISAVENLSLHAFLIGLLGSGMEAIVQQALAIDCNCSIELPCSEELSDGVWMLSRHAFKDPSLAGSSLWILTDITQRRLVEVARDQFVFTATHELRTPLANIRAYAETIAMADEMNVEEQKGFVNIINTEASRLARFIDDLLNISQMEVGAITIDRHETDVMRMLHELKEVVQSLVEKKQQQFELKIPAKLPKLWIDKDKIAGAITNLLSNANKYTPDGGRIRLIVEEDAETLNIHVEDTGYGISSEELPRICQKFFRSQDERVRDETGSGIGLAFSQEVAKLHGGRISIRSELNKGSRFTLTLPLTLKRK